MKFNYSLLLQAQKITTLSEIEFAVIGAVIAFDVLTTSWFTAALHKKLAMKIQPFASLFLAGGRALLMLAGIFLGMLMQLTLGQYSFASAMSLLVIVGIKSCLDAINYNVDEKVILIDNITTALLLSAAGGIVAFLTGLAIGTAGGPMLLPVISVFFATLFLVIAGIKAGEHYGFKPSIKYAGLLSGIVIACFGVIHLVLQFI